jgi:cytochrome P450 family 6
MKDPNTFPDRIMAVNANLDPMFGKALFTSKGQRWRQVRVNLTPVFTSGKKKNMFYLVVLCCKDLTDCMERETAKGV